MSTRQKVLTLILSSALLGVACGGSADNAIDDQHEASNRVSEQVIDQGAVVVKDQLYDPATALTEAYWYSRYNLGHLVMRTGMGIQWMPPSEKVAQMMDMAGIAEGPVNPYLVQALYASGDPHLVNEFNGNESDFSNFRWDQDKMDKTITPQATGYTIIKEVIWAKSFASNIEGDNPMNHFRALVLSAEAAAQAKFATSNLLSAGGLYVSGWEEGRVTDSETVARDQVVMLWALSELYDYTTGAYGWYGAPIDEVQVLSWIDDLVSALEDEVETNPTYLAGMQSRDLGEAISALSAYLGYAPQGASSSYVLETLLPQLATELVGRTSKQGRVSTKGRYSQASTQAAAIQGFVFAYSLAGGPELRSAALRAWDYLETLWDEHANLYIPTEGDIDYVYTVEDVGDIVGALNSLQNGLSVDVVERFATFFNAAVNESGLQIAEAPPTGAANDSDTIPSISGAGGLFGQGPMLASEVVYDSATGDWEVVNPNFTTALAMSADNQFMRISTWGGQPAAPGHGIPGEILQR